MNTTTFIIIVLVIIAALFHIAEGEAYQGIGTGFVGDGTVIKEESPMFGLPYVDSFSVTDDVPGYGGIKTRETKYFDCSKNLYGEKVCKERWSY